MYNQGDIESRLSEKVNPEEVAGNDSQTTMKVRLENSIFKTIANPKLGLSIGVQCRQCQFTI